VHYLFPQK